MTEWKAKRFWTKAHVIEADGGFRVTLDDRPINTPGKLPLILPTSAMAHAIAEEWDAQDGEIDPLTMPTTRSANSAVERVAPQHAAVAQMLAAYAETDLLCHRAEQPEELVQLQVEGWDPVLDWADQKYGARLQVGAGILPIQQSQDALGRLAKAVEDTPAFPMTALHDMISLTGSIVLGLAMADGHLTAAKAWDLSRIDEEWQIAQWGRDEEADAASNARRLQLFHAERFWGLCFPD